MLRTLDMLRSPVAVLLIAALLFPLAAPAAAIAEKDLPEVYRLWLQEVDPIITKAERKAFLELEKDYQRDAFIERFWQVRDPYPDTARNELRDSWGTRVTEAKQNFGSLDDERARFYLLNGSPAARLVDECGVLLWPTEVWIYPPPSASPRSWSSSSTSASSRGSSASGSPPTGSRR